MELNNYISIHTVKYIRQPTINLKVKNDIHEKICILAFSILLSSFAFYLGYSGAFSSRNIYRLDFMA